MNLVNTHEKIEQLAVEVLEDLIAKKNSIKNRIAIKKNVVNKSDNESQFNMAGFIDDIKLTHDESIKELERQRKAAAITYKNSANNKSIDIIWYAEMPPREDWVAGMAFPAGEGYVLSDDYDALKKKLGDKCRPPIAVVMPSRRSCDLNGVIDFCLDGMTSRSWDNKNGYTVTVQNELVVGQKVLVTVSPSVVLPAIWHAFIRAGSILPDMRDWRNETVVNGN